MTNSKLFDLNFALNHFSKHSDESFNSAMSISESNREKYYQIRKEVVRSASHIKNKAKNLEQIRFSCHSPFQEYSKH